MSLHSPLTHKVALKDSYLEKPYATGFRMTIQPSSLSSPDLSNASQLADKNPQYITNYRTSSSYDR
jgi:hypothetical protein